MENFKTKEVQESINLNLDIKKAKNKLKWQPKWKIKKLLKKQISGMKIFIIKRI